MLKVGGMVKVVHFILTCHHALPSPTTISDQVNTHECQSPRHVQVQVRAEFIIIKLLEITQIDGFFLGLVVNCR